MCMCASVATRVCVCKLPRVGTAKVSHTCLALMCQPNEHA
jgi:hypothetical protein